MVKVVIVNGMPESGKTTMQEICSNKLKDLKWNTAIKSSIEWVKDIATYAGWNGEKTDKNRKFLCDLKKALTDWDDAILKQLTKEVNYYHYQLENTVIFIDIREPVEIEKAKKAFNATTLVISRPQVESNQWSNPSDMNVFEYDYDYYLLNDKGLSELEVAVEKFIDEAIINNDNNIYNPEENCN